VNAHHIAHPQLLRHFKLQRGQVTSHFSQSILCYYFIAHIAFRQKQFQRANEL
jgi:hypothetical protein